ncbi:hypothetical protein TRFO_34125 [Tritrichomonas foetus]|uniref:Cilium assembly protein DZIP1 N-terminal domain-containing protein n=1 Tax=Tritrichomonas foetus TaxID=1144522 RepID=A0A1J4JPG0_9EUKA|nr:hypothetical protein TRFO_34125 [Tritrichomonas foetus]|eukprot:OHS99405.1 hypothetical protein TRFO_34125 [Tritrichomonas foetus]
MPLNWNLVQDVNVDQIARDMDVSSLEYLVQHIAFANLTDADAQRFQDRGALKAFKLLQLGVEYLTHLKRPLPTQPDSSDLKKALSESQRRVEELESLLYESEMKRERAQASSKIYKHRYEALQRQIDDEGEDEGEIRGIENKDVDPFASVQKEINQMRQIVEKRGKALNERADSWKRKTRHQSEIPPRTVTAHQIEELFKPPNEVKRNKKPAMYRYAQRSEQGSLPT